MSERDRSQPDDPDQGDGIPLPPHSRRTPRGEPDPSSGGPATSGAGADDDDVGLPGPPGDVVPPGIGYRPADARVPAPPPRNRGCSLILLGLIGVAGLLAALAFAGVRSQIVVPAGWVPVTAEVTATQSSDDTCTVRYSYRVGAKRHDFSETVGATEDCPAVGTQVEVYHDPEDPANARVPHPTAVVVMTGLALLGVVIAGSMIWLLLRIRRQ